MDPAPRRGGMGYAVLCTDERRQSSLLPTPQHSALLVEISEGSGYSGCSKGSESKREGFGKAGDMKSCS